MIHIVFNSIYSFCDPLKIFYIIGATLRNRNYMINGCINPRNKLFASISAFIFLFFNEGFYG